VAAGPPERPTLKEWGQRGARSAFSPVGMQTRTWRPSPSARVSAEIALRFAIPCHTAVTTPMQTAVVWRWLPRSRHGHLVVVRVSRVWRLRTPAMRPYLIACAPCGWGPDLERSD
jgi:hypothetical protein